MALVVAALASHNRALSDVARVVGRTPVAEHERHRLERLADLSLARGAARVLLIAAEDTVALVLDLAEVLLAVVVREASVENILGYDGGREGDGGEMTVR